MGRSHKEADCQVWEYLFDAIIKRVGSHTRQRMIRRQRRILPIQWFKSTRHSYRWVGPCQGRLGGQFDTQIFMAMLKEFIRLMVLELLGEKLRIGITFNLYLLILLVALIGPRIYYNREQNMYSTSNSGVHTRCIWQHGVVILHEDVG
jgi:hypothetical protein